MSDDLNFSKMTKAELRHYLGTYINGSPVYKAALAELAKKEKAEEEKLDSQFSKSIRWSKIFKFQNIEEIEDTFSMLFSPGGYLKAIEEHQHHCHILSKSSGPVTLKLSEEWRKDFAFLFECRHRLVHDANLQCDVPPKKMAELETLALMLCQFTSFLIDKQYGKTLALEKDGKPAFFIVDDFLSDDWEVSDVEGYTIINKP